MKRQLLFSIVVSCTLLLAVGTLSYGAPTNRDVGTYITADNGDNWATPVAVSFAVANVEQCVIIEAAYPYAGEVKTYATRSSDRRVCLFNLARDGLS